MGKVLQFKKRDQVGKAAEKMVEIADEIDSVILRRLSDSEVDARDLAGLLAHRLGTLMSHIEEKSELWYICEKVLKKQARLD